MKTCSKCGFVGDDSLFEEKSNICKKCRKEYKKELIKKQEEKETKTCSKC